VDPAQQTATAKPAQSERGQAPAPAERREWNIPDYEDIDTTPEVTAYSARR
jgi:hypothetical protein